MMHRLLPHMPANIYSDASVCVCVFGFVCMPKRANRKMEKMQQKRKCHHLPKLKLESLVGVFYFIKNFVRSTSCMGNRASSIPHIAANTHTHTYHRTRAHIFGTRNNKYVAWPLTPSFSLFTYFPENFVSLFCANTSLENFSINVYEHVVFLVSIL